jgi:hypothetical protein
MHNFIMLHGDMHGWWEVIAFVSLMVAPCVIATRACEDAEAAEAD